MQEPSRDQSRIKEIRSTLASLDVDVKLLRLDMKAGFNPNQPRVPAGNSDGGQWIDSGSTQGSARQRPTSSPALDDARISTQFGRGNSISSPESRHTVTLSNGKKFVFETEGPRQTVFDGKGNRSARQSGRPPGRKACPSFSKPTCPRARPLKPSTPRAGYTIGLRLATPRNNAPASPSRRKSSSLTRYCRSSISSECSPAPTRPPFAADWTRCSASQMKPPSKQERRELTQARQSSALPFTHGCIRK